MPRKPLPGKTNSAPHGRLSTEGVDSRAASYDYRASMSSHQALDSTGSLTGMVAQIAMTEYEKADLALAERTLALAQGNIARAGDALFAAELTAYSTAASALISAFIAYLMLRGIQQMTRLNNTRAAQAETAQKAMEGMLTALTELIRRTSPPPSQDGSKPGPDE